MIFLEVHGKPRFDGIMLIREGPVETYTEERAERAERAERSAKLIFYFLASCLPDETLESLLQLLESEHAKKGMDRD